MRCPAEEVCHTFWFNAVGGFFKGPTLADSCETSTLAVAEVVQIVSNLASRPISKSQVLM